MLAKHLREPAGARAGDGTLESEVFDRDPAVRELPRKPSFAAGGEHDEVTGTGGLQFPSQVREHALRASRPVGLNQVREAEAPQRTSGRRVACCQRQVVGEGSFGYHRCTPIGQARHSGNPTKRSWSFTALSSCDMQKRGRSSRPRCRLSVVPARSTEASIPPSPPPTTVRSSNRPNGTARMGSTSPKRSSSARRAAATPPLTSPPATTRRARPATL